MSLLTVSKPLSFWRLLAFRLQSEIVNQDKRCAALSRPMQVSIESKDDAARLARAQGELETAIRRFESLTLLALGLEAQVEACEFHIEARSLMARIAFMERMKSFYLELSTSRESRAEADQAVAQTRAAFASASKPGGGEWAASERGRLLGLQLQVPVMATEEAAQFVVSAQNLHNDLDAAKSELDTIRATTTLQISVQPSMQSILQELGIGIQEPASQTEAQAGTPAQEAANAADAGAVHDQTAA